MIIYAVVDFTGLDSVWSTYELAEERSQELENLLGKYVENYIVEMEVDAK